MSYLCTRKIQNPVSIKLNSDRQIHTNIKIPAFIMDEEQIRKLLTRTSETNPFGVIL